MGLKRFFVFLPLIVISTVSMAQRTFDDLMGRKLIGVGYAWPDKLDRYGKPKMYPQQTSLTWQFNSDGTLVWNENGEKTFHYTLTGNRVSLNGSNYKLMFFKEWPYTRDNVNYRAYITAQSNDSVLHYFKLSQSDCYALYEKALSENRLYAAYDYMHLLCENGDYFVECALAYLEETIADFPGDGDVVVNYSMANFHAKKIDSKYLQRLVNEQHTALLGTGDPIFQNTSVAEKNFFFVPNAEQRKVIRAFSLQRVGVQEIYYQHENEEERVANISSAVENLQEAVEANNDAVSNFYLGKIYYEGLLGFKEKKRGLTYIQTAANQGSALANCYLGNLKKEEGDISEAKKLWKLAANAKLVRPEVRITTIETLGAVNPDTPKVREAVKQSKENLKKYSK